MYFFCLFHDILFSRIFFVPRKVNPLSTFSYPLFVSLKADVPLLISNGNTHTVSFGGIGCDPHQETALTDTQSNNDVLSKQIILVPDQVSKLS